jgi:flagellar hook-basal body complex protein FliE
MSDMQIDQVLAQMHSLAQQVSMNGAEPPTAPVNAEQFSFAQLLKQSLDQVSEIQRTASSMRTAFEQGDPQITLVDTMVASQKSSVAFDAVTQVRKQLLSAYKDVMSMSV